MGDVENRATIDVEWEQYQAPVFNFMRRMGASHTLAADLSQETFVRAIRGAHRYRADAPVLAWVLGIARNVFREWLRSGKREVPVAEIYDEPNPAVSVDEPVDVEQALARLDPDDSEILVLRFVLDLPSKTVAAALGISDDAVRQRVARAKVEFRKAWDV